MSRTSVIYDIVNSLVLAFESTQSATLLLALAEGFLPFIRNIGCLFYTSAPLTLAKGVRHIYPRLRYLFGAKACFFTAARSLSGGRTRVRAKKNTPYHPKISPQSLFALTKNYFICVLLIYINTRISS